MLKKFTDYVAPFNLEVDCPMSGDPDAKIALIGEYPNVKECALKKPFSTSGSKILWDSLRNYGQNKATVYATNVIKCHVSSMAGVSVNELEQWKGALEFEIRNLPNLEVIIAFGEIALLVLTGHKNITHHRGSVYYYTKVNGKRIPIVMSATPLSTVYQTETAIIFSMDISKAFKILNNEFDIPEINCILNPTFEEAMDYMKQIAEVHKTFTIDIEWTNVEIACFGLGISPTEAMCINFRDQRENRFTLEQEYKLLQCFVELCDREDTFVIAQNMNFDSHAMGFKDAAFFKGNFDTMLGHHTLYPRLPHNLGFLTSQYTNHPYYKDGKDAFKDGGDIDLFWRYNCFDCAITFAVFLEVQKELKEQNMYDFFINHVMRMQPHLAFATVTGVKVDLEKKEILNKELTIDIEEKENALLKDIREHLKEPNYSFNLNSPRQMQDFLFNKLGLQHQRKSADVKVRDDLLEDKRTPLEVKTILGQINAYATEKKFLSTYVNTNIDPDGRFRAEFKQAGVIKAPGRLSSAKTLWGSGGNAQNQPHRAYEMYLPDDDCVFIYFDLAQAEARYVAWDAQIESWMEDFERARLDGKFDAHRSLASTMFNIDYELVPISDMDENGNVTIRFIAKRCRHGLNYRMHISRLAQTTGLSYGQAAQNYYLYHRTTPELKIWWSAIEREVRQNRAMFNSFGRRFIILEDLSKSDLMDSIIAYKPQSSIGDKTQRVWYQCHEDERWDHNQARIALNVHDALYAISTPRFAKTALSIMKKYAEEPIMVTPTGTKKTLPMIIPADCKISVPGEDGIHRMSTLESVDIQCAA